MPPPKAKPKGKKAAAAAALQVSQAVPSPAVAPTPGPNPLIAQLNAVAANDPLLAEILRLAATKQANPSQLQALARYIQALQTEMDRRQTSGSPPAQANGSPLPAGLVPNKQDASASPPVQGPSHTPTPSTSRPQPAPPSRPLLLVEFRESSTDRWSLPSSFSATLSKPPTTATSHDGAALLSFYLTAPPAPPSTADAKGKKKAAAAAAANTASPALDESGEGAYPVVVRLTDVSRTMWEGIERCIQSTEDERIKRDEQWARFAKMVPPRVYLQFRLKGAVEKVRLKRNDV
jgi:hypothetical protein